MAQGREGLLDDVTVLAQIFDGRGALAGNYRQDPAPAQLTEVGIAVVSLVAEHGVRSVPWLVEFVCRLQLGEQDAVQPVEDTGLVSPAQPTTAGLPEPNPDSGDTVAS
ncbi:hypothetical protein GCM10022232_93570 [Streptomyces plumbiresistens]|uniref:Transposase n=1 Tax=Streptomyces plumbiresistens TaxID=511811 RepID=A0ABP7TY02_9ACTN